MMQTQITPVAQFEEIVLESIVFSRSMPDRLIAQAAEALADRLEARGVWQGCETGCTCKLCAEYNPLHA